MTNRSVPPDFLIRMIERALPYDQQQMVLGDLSEEWNRRRKAFSLLAADRWLAGQALLFSANRARGAIREWDTIGWLREIRLAFRTLARQPGYFTVTVATIALGVGASTAIFSIVHGVLMTPIDLPEPQEVVSIWTDESRLDYAPLTAPDFKAIDAEVESFEYVAARWMDRLPLLGDHEPEEVHVASVTDDYFEVLEIQPALGTSLDRTQPTDVVISDGLWRRRYGSSLSILGAGVQLGTGSYRIVGVLPTSPNPNVPNMAGVVEDTDVWRVMPEQWLTFGWDVAFLRVTGRVRDGVTVAQANEELATFLRALNPEAGRDPGELAVFAVGLHDHIVASVRTTLFLLFGAILLLLVVACANVAQLALARAGGQRAHLAVRSALGGGRIRLAWGLVAESLVVAVLGGAMGLLLAAAAVRGLVAIQPSSLPRIDEIRITGAVLGFTVVTIFASAILFGLAPAIQATAGRLSNALRSRSVSRSRMFKRSSRALVVSEVALTFVLVAGSGLLFRTFLSLTAVDPGYDTRDLMTMSLTPMRGADDEEEREVFLREMERVSLSLPGVTGVGFANRMPLTGGLYTGAWATRETFGSDDRVLSADVRFVSPGYHETLGIDLITGRGFDPSDSSAVVIVDEHLVQAAFGTGDPLGKEIWTDTFGIDGWATIVGVVEHARHASITEDAAPTIYFSAFAEPAASTWLTAVRTDGQSPANVVAPLRTALRKIDPGATLSRTQSMNARVSDALAVHRLALSLMGAFALAAALLAVLGIYGLLALTVHHRRRELAVRMALGAPRTRVTGSVLREGIALAGIGIGLGMLVSFGLTQLLRSLLYGVKPIDPLVLGAASGIIVMMGLIGSYVPARRAVAVDPAAAMRD